LGRKPRSEIGDDSRGELLHPRFEDVDIEEFLGSAAQGVYGAKQPFVAGLFELHRVESAPPDLEIGFVRVPLVKVFAERVRAGFLSAGGDPARDSSIEMASTDAFLGSVSPVPGDRIPSPIITPTAS